MTETNKLRVLELYSGIGGMHCALQESGVPFEIVAAIDINTTANKIYRHNFRGTYLIESGIETLTIAQLDRMKIDMILMSPPCQPFTRVGKKRDNEDIRTKSFLHLLDLLPQLSHCPGYILVENVKGFEESQTRDLLIKSLQKCQFKIQEYMLTPLQFGIPNSRLRYYLIAKRQSQNPNCTLPKISDIIYEVPGIVDPYLRYKISCDEEESCYHDKTASEKDSKIASPMTENEKKLPQLASEAESNQSSSKCLSDVNTTHEKCSGDQCNSRESVNLCTNEQSMVNKLSKTKRLKTKHCSDTDCDVKHSDDEDVDSSCCLCDNDRELLKVGQLMRQDDDTLESQIKSLRLFNFLEKAQSEYFHEYRVPDKELKRFIVMDVVMPCLRKTICFTKRYGHYMEGAGSIIQMSTDVESVKKARDLKLEAIDQKNNKMWGEREISIIRELNLRYFTPREIANLLCFPDTYSFPDDTSTIQKNRVLGNSLNVHVVSILIRLLTIK